MNNQQDNVSALVHQFSQDEFLRKVEFEYITSATTPSAGAIESDPSVEDTNFTASSIMDVAAAIDPGTDKEDGNERLHFRNRAQNAHTVNAEKSAIAYWANNPEHSC